MKRDIGTNKYNDIINTKKPSIKNKKSTEHIKLLVHTKAEPFKIIFKA
jgi:hypothetical protein